MYENILVPVDFSPGNSKALETAIKLAPSKKGVITLFHVIESINDTDYMEIKDFYLKLEKKAHDELARLAGLFSDSGVKIRLKTEIGERAGSILKYAAERKCDLIVMNSHRIKPDDGAAGWGTISYKVGILSQCPVMLVK